MAPSNGSLARPGENARASVASRCPSWWRSPGRAGAMVTIIGAVVSPVRTGARPIQKIPTWRASTALESGWRSGAHGGPYRPGCPASTSPSMSACASIRSSRARRRPILQHDRIVLLGEASLLLLDVDEVTGARRLRLQVEAVVLGGGHDVRQSARHLDAQVLQLAHLVGVVGEELDRGDVQADQHVRGHAVVPLVVPE